MGITRLPGFLSRLLSNGYLAYGTSQPDALSFRNQAFRKPMTMTSLRNPARAQDVSKL